MKETKNYWKYIVYALLAILGFNIIAILIRKPLINNGSSSGKTTIEPFHDDGAIRDEFIKEMQSTTKRMTELVDILVEAYNDHKHGSKEEENEPKPPSKATKVKASHKKEIKKEQEHENDEVIGTEIDDISKKEDPKDVIETFQAANEDRRFMGYMLL